MNYVYDALDRLIKQTEEDLRRLRGKPFCFVLKVRLQTLQEAKRAIADTYLRNTLL